MLAPSALLARCSWPRCSGSARGAPGRLPPARRAARSGARRLGARRHRRAAPPRRGDDPRPGRWRCACSTTTARSPHLRAPPRPMPGARSVTSRRATACSSSTSRRGPAAGTLTELLGAAAPGRRSRHPRARHGTRRRSGSLAALPTPGESRRSLDAYAAGVNAYLAGMRPPGPPARVPPARPAPGPVDPRRLAPGHAAHGLHPGLKRQ